MRDAPNTTYSRGVANRAKLRRLILPHLYPGCMIPRGAFLGRLLGITPTNANAQMRKVLLEAGITTEIRAAPGNHGGTRVYVVAMPEQPAQERAA